MMESKVTNGPVKSIVGSIVVGIVMLLGQFIIQPLIAEKSLAKQELWRAKLKTYSEAITLVNKKFATIEWHEDGQASSSPTSEPPSVLDANNCFSKLVLLSTDNRIPRAFMSCMVPYDSNKTVTIGDLEKMIKLLRKDLKAGRSTIDTADIRFITSW